MYLNIVFTFAATFQSIFAAGWNSTSYANNAGHAHPKAASQIPIDSSEDSKKERHSVTIQTLTAWQVG
jgi:hypothetical protein